MTTKSRVKRKKAPKKKGPPKLPKTEAKEQRTGYARMNMNLSVVNMEILKALAKKRGTTMTDVLQQAINTEKYIDDVSKAGGKILVETKKGRVRELVFR